MKGSACAERAAIDQSCEVSVLAWILVSMTESRPKKVVVDPMEASHPLTLHKYSSILSSLKKSSSWSSAFSRQLTEAKLAALVASMRVSMEDLCGKDSPKPRPITKIPMSLFRDFTADGPLDCMLGLLCSEAAKANVGITDLFKDSKRASSLLVLVEKELIKQGHLKRPKVFLNKVPVGKINLLSKIVQEHGGSLSPTEDGATHVIDWNEEVDAQSPDSADDFIRILELRGPTDSVALPGGSILPAASGAALVHWWYFPDSYNEWIPDTEISVGDSPDLASLTAPTRDKWYVCCRFVLDCDVFNEWGNPLDYENENNEALGAEEVALEQLSAAAAGAEMGLLLGASGEASPRSSAKKSRNNRKRFSQLAVGAGDKTARDAPVLGSAAGADKLQADAIPPSLRPGGPSQTLEMAAALGEHRLVEVGSKRSAAEAQLDSSGSTAVECTLPAGIAEPAWFQQGAISEVEVHALGAACTADVSDYLKIRNGIINLCAQSPLQYITATECRRKLPGDVSKILQVHEFLSAFALINGRARREARPDIAAAAMAASASALKRVSSGGGATGGSGGWDARDDAALLAAISKHKGKHAASLNWAAVAADAGSGRSAADCAARFVELQLSPGGAGPQQTKDGSGSHTIADSGSVVSLVRALAESVLSGGLSAEAKSAVAAAAHAAVEAKVEQNQEALRVLGEEYVRCKLELLQEKVTLLQGVEAAFEAERVRTEVDRRELQVLRAQLALTQQSLLPPEPAPGNII